MTAMNTINAIPIAHEIGVDAARFPRGDLPGGLADAALLVRRERQARVQRRHEHRVHHLLDLAASEGGTTVTGGDRLALLGDVFAAVAEGAVAWLIAMVGLLLVIRWIGQRG